MTDCTNAGAFAAPVPATGATSGSDQCFELLSLLTEADLLRDISLERMLDTMLAGRIEQ